MLPFPTPVRRALAACLSTALALGACGEIHTDADDDDDLVDPDSGARGGRDAATQQDARRPGSSSGDSSKPDARNDYVDPTCPDPPPANEDYQCDPIAQSGCQPGEQCAPFVDYPTDSCSAETYGAFCVPAGTLEQGEPCDSQLDCAAGYICLITGAGTTCGRSCDLASSSDCPDGLVCTATDVNGIGACY